MLTSDLLLEKMSVKNELTEMHPSSLGGKKDREDTGISLKADPRRGLRAISNNISHVLPEKDNAS